MNTYNDNNVLQCENPFYYMYFCLCSRWTFSAVEVERGGREQTSKHLNRKLTMVMSEWARGGWFVLHHLPVKGL